MNKFILEPTDENLERFKKKLKEQQFIGIQPIFFRYDSAIEDELSVIFDAYSDVFEDGKLLTKQNSRSHE